MENSKIMKEWQNAIPHEDIKHRDTLKALLKGQAVSSTTCSGTHMMDKAGGKPSSSRGSFFLTTNGPLRERMTRKDFERISAMTHATAAKKK